MYTTQTDWFSTSFRFRKFSGAIYTQSHTAQSDHNTYYKT